MSAFRKVGNDVATVWQHEDCRHTFRGNGIPWVDYLHYRHRLIHAFAAEGKTATEITLLLGMHDLTQIELLMATPLEP